MREHGIVADWQGYDNLPLRVLEDARLLMEADGIEQQRKSAARAEQTRRRR